MGSIFQQIKIHVVLFQPKIHWNTGNIGRQCLGYGATLHLIKPYGFQIDDKHLKRAGLDYWGEVQLEEYDNWGNFKSRLPSLGKAYYFTKFANKSLLDTQFEFTKEKNNERHSIVLVFGSETDGLKEVWSDIPDEGKVSLPMSEQSVRSFNLSNSVSAAMWETLRQFYHMKAPK